MLDAAAFGSAGERCDANAGGGAPGVFALDTDEGEGLAEGGAEAELVVERDGALVDCGGRGLGSRGCRLSWTLGASGWCISARRGSDGRQPSLAAARWKLAGFDPFGEDVEQRPSQSGRPDSGRVDARAAAGQHAARLDRPWRERFALLGIEAVFHLRNAHELADEAAEMDGELDGLLGFVDRSEPGAGLIA